MNIRTLSIVTIVLLLSSCQSSNTFDSSIDTTEVIDTTGVKNIDKLADSLYKSINKSKEEKRVNALRNEIFALNIVKIRSDENFAKYVTIDCINNIEKKVVAISFRISNKSNNCNEVIKKKVKISPYSKMTISIKLADKCSENITTIIDEVVYSNGDFVTGMDIFTTSVENWKKNNR